MAAAQAVETVTTVEGFVELNVADPVSFIQDANALRALRRSIADIAGVKTEYVNLTAKLETSTITETTTESTTTVIRRLSGGNVIISFVIRVPTTDIVASARVVSGSVQAAIEGTNAEVVLTQLLTGSPIFTVYKATIQNLDTASTPLATLPLPSGSSGAGAEPKREGAFISGIVVSVVGLGCLSIGVCAFVLRRRTGGRGSGNTGGKDSVGNGGEEVSEDAGTKSTDDQVAGGGVCEGEVFSLDDFLGADPEPDELVSVDDPIRVGKAPGPAAASAMDAEVLDAGDCFDVDELIQAGGSFALDDCIRYASFCRQAPWVEEAESCSFDAAIAGMRKSGSSQSQHAPDDSRQSAPPATARISLRQGLQMQANSVVSLDLAEDEEEHTIAI